MKQLKWQVALSLIFCVFISFVSKTSFAKSGYIITKQKQCKILIGNLGTLKLKDRLTFKTSEDVAVTVEISGINKAQGAIGWIIPREKCPNILNLEGVLEQKEETSESETEESTDTSSQPPVDPIKKQTKTGSKHSFGLAFTWDILYLKAEKNEAIFSGPSFGFYYRFNGGALEGATWSLRTASYFSMLTHRDSILGITAKTQLLLAELEVSPQLLIMRCGDDESYGCHIGPEFGFSSGLGKTTVTSTNENFKPTGNPTTRIQTYSYGARTGLLYLPSKHSRFDFALAFRMGEFTASQNGQKSSHNTQIWRFEIAYEYAF